MITDYTSLKDEVAAFSHRSDLTDQMDTFAQLAEAMINKDLRSAAMEVRSTESFNAQFYDLPSDYLEMRALEITINSQKTPLKQLTPQQLDALSQSTGSPRAYTIHAGQIEFSPGIDPSAPYDGQLIYYRKVPTLTSNSTNDVLTDTPLIYLSAMMIQVYLYLQDDAELTKWNSAYELQISQANKVGQAGRYILPQIRN